MPRLNGSTHVNLTVADLDRSTEWYCRVFDMLVVNDVTPPGSGFRFRTLLESRSLASVVLGQPQIAVPGSPDRFDESRVGLHHLAYHVPERDDLDAWAAHLNDVGVPHSGVQISGSEAGVQIWLRDPDNVWLEFYWVNRDFFIDRLRQQWRAARAGGARRTLAGPAAHQMAGRMAAVRTSPASTANRPQIVDGGAAIVSPA
jgi:catechol 2,3-dioxygenase-like lactoylglutathione lyase family enzyme